MSRADTDPQPAVPGPADADPQPAVPGPAEADPQPAVPGPAEAGRQSVVPGPATPGPDEGGPLPGQIDSGPVGAVESQETARRPPWRGWEPIIRVAGVVIAILASFVSGVFELLLSTLRAGDVTAVWRGDAIGSGGGPLLGLSILLAAVLNYGIAWFAVSTTGRRWALGPPWALWTLMMLFAAGVRTNEGDYLLGGTNWVALVMILVGSLSYAVYSYRMILKRVTR